MRPQVPSQPRPPPAAARAGAGAGVSEHDRLLRRQLYLAEEARPGGRVSHRGRLGQGRYLYDVRKILGVLDPLPPLSEFGSVVQY